MHVDHDGWLVADAPADPKVLVVPAHRARMGSTYDTASGWPLAPVWHTTDMAAPAEALARRWQQPDRQASAHVIIGRNGAIYQCVPLRRVAFHVKGPGLVAGKVVDHVNHYAAGIELDNIGGLRRIVDANGNPGFYAWPYYRPDVQGHADESLGPDPVLRLPAPRAQSVQLVEGRYCDAFTAAQLVAAVAALRAMRLACGWQQGHCGAGHVDYEPARKLDPWPLWRTRHQGDVIAQAFANG